MSGMDINFGGEKIKKSNFYKNKKLFNIYDIDVSRILISKKESSAKKISFKYIIGYNDDDDDDDDDDNVIRPLCIKLHPMIGYIKCFDSNKTMSFKVNNNNHLKRYTKIWKKASNLMDIEFDSEPVYSDNNKYKKTKIKSYGDKINTNFKGKKNTEKMHHINVYH